jgi:hypothetical protein
MLFEALSNIFGPFFASFPLTLTPKKLKVTRVLFSFA